MSALRPGVTVVQQPDTNSIDTKDEDEDVNGINENLPSRFGEEDEDDRFIFDVEERTTTTQRPPGRRPFNQSPPQSRKARN